MFPEVFFDFCLAFGFILSVNELVDRQALFLSALQNLLTRAGRNASRAGQNKNVIFVRTTDDCPVIETALV